MQNWMSHGSHRPDALPWQTRMFSPRTVIPRDSAHPEVVTQLPGLRTEAALSRGVGGRRWTPSQRVCSCRSRTPHISKAPPSLHRADLMPVPCWRRRCEVALRQQQEYFCCPLFSWRISLSASPPHHAGKRKKDVKESEHGETPIEY